MKHWIWMFFTVEALFVAATRSEAAQMTVTVVGNDIVVTVTGSMLCVGVWVDDPDAGNATCGGVTYSYSETLACNEVGDHVVYGHYLPSNGNVYIDLPPQTVTVSTTAPANCALFDLYPARGQTRILTHKYDSRDTYPVGQTADAEIPIILKPRRIPPGATIYLRVYDPPDTASYSTAFDATRAWGDNADPNAGTIGGSKTASIMIPDTGPVTYPSVTLRITERDAGDNYLVVASADPALLTDTSPNPWLTVCASGCLSTSQFPMTAWKRVYLEKKRMFRAGGFISGTAAAGQNVVNVTNPGRNPFKAGDVVRFIHAPRLDGTGPSDFYSEDATIQSVAGSRTCKLTLVYNLQHDYGEDRSPSAQIAADPMSDAVGLLSAGFYERNDAYVQDLFGKAFVQYYCDAPAANTEVPYVPVVKDPLLFANKWFENSCVSGMDGERPGNANVRHVLGGSSRADGLGQVDKQILGETGTSLVSKLSSPNDCWTFVGTIDLEVRDRNAAIHDFDPVIVNGENVVHELAHTWSVDYQHFAGYPGHCGEMMGSTPSKFCTMNPNNQKEIGDGLVDFHWISNEDSEYMTIRRQVEPVPAP